MVIRSLTVGTTQVRLLGTNIDRTSIVIQNTHATATLWLTDSTPAVANYGIRIESGQSVSFKIPEDDPTTELWIISDTASTTVSVYEGFGARE